MDVCAKHKHAVGNSGVNVMVRPLREGENFNLRRGKSDSASPGFA
jgi:hypothetical protein